MHLRNIASFNRTARRALQAGERLELALGFALAGELGVAAQLAGNSEAARKRLGFERELTEQTTRTALENALEEGVPAAELTGLLERGAALAAGEAVGLALAPGPA